MKARISEQRVWHTTLHLQHMSSFSESSDSKVCQQSARQFITWRMCDAEKCLGAFRRSFLVGRASAAIASSFKQNGFKFPGFEKFTASKQSSGDAVPQGHIATPPVVIFMLMLPFLLLLRPCSRMGRLYICNISMHPYEVRKSVRGVHKYMSSRAAYTNGQDWGRFDMLQVEKHIPHHEIPQLSVTCLDTYVSPNSSQHHIPT